MKAKDIIKELSLPRTTFYRYVERGIIKAKKLPSGQYVYDEESVNKLKNELSSYKKDPKKVVLYQTGEYLKSIQLGSKRGQNVNNVKVDLTFTDYSSHIEFTNKKGLIKLITLILNDKVSAVYLPNRKALGPRDIFAVFSLICQTKKVKLKLLKNEGKNNE